MISNNAADQAESVKIIDPDGFCPLFTPRYFPAPANKCWFCRYGDFTKSYGKEGKSGICGHKYASPYLSSYLKQSDVKKERKL